MRRKGSAVAGLALIGVLTACAAQPDHVGFGEHLPAHLPAHPQGPAPGSAAPPSDELRRPAWPGPPPGAVAVPAAQIDAAALPAGYPRLAWTEGDGRTIGANGQEGGCTQVHSELREQTPQLVRITFVEVTTSPGPCTMDLRFRPLTGQLDVPLGQRTVVLEHQMR